MHYVNEYDRPEGKFGKLVHTFAGYKDRETAEAEAAKQRSSSRLAAGHSIRVEENVQHWEDKQFNREMRNYNLMRCGRSLAGGA